jgi:hypothetical protein
MHLNWLTSTAFKATLGLSAGLLFGGMTAALALDCNADVASLMKKRVDTMGALNANAKANKGKLDPIAGCAKLKNLVVVDREIEAYFKKNKEWCSIPEEAMANMSADLEKTTAVATQACTIAEKMKKAQQQQAAGGGGLPGEQAQKLPTGPL